MSQIYRNRPYNSDRFILKSACLIYNFASLSSAETSFTSSKNLSGIPSVCQNSLDSDQVKHFVGPDLGPTCLQTSAENNICRMQGKKHISADCKMDYLTL